ncbi:MAG: threonine ammonia-lyase [Actinomycetota bacterium]|nr:threonine ammonia-lyase [Actinomycetota bacterium]
MLTGCVAVVGETHLVGVAEIRAAQVVLSGIVRRTPMEASRVLSDKVGGPVFFKCENRQRTGSFKIRGAYLRISRLTDEQRGRGVVAASAGNHAQGVALAASLLGASATVFMPTSAPLPKIAATRGYGAQIHLIGHTIAEPMEAARAYAAETGAVFIHPFDHPDLIAGQGTVGLEILEQCPEVATIVVCTGGGGLLAGIGAAVKGLRPEVWVSGAQAAEAAAFPASLAEGAPVTLAAMDTMADGIAVPAPSDLTFAHVRTLVDEIVTVSEESLSRALLLCLERAKFVVEPAGVAGVAAVLDNPSAFQPPVVIVLSGGNVDPVLLLRVIEHGMVAAGRYLSVRLRAPDQPGSLAKVLSVVAELGASVRAVEHSRTGSSLHLGEVAVALSLETRGAEHRTEVVQALRAAGYPVEVQ